MYEDQIAVKLYWEVGEFLSVDWNLVNKIERKKYKMFKWSTYLKEFFFYLFY